MSLTLNMVGGIDGSTVVGEAWHTDYGTTYTNVASSGSSSQYSYAYADYFTFSNGVFTAVQAGTYKIYYFGRGGYNNAGSAINMYYRIYAAGSNVASATDVGNGGVRSSVTVTLSVGDTIYAQTRNSSGNNTHDFGYVITKT